MNLKDMSFDEFKDFIVENIRGFLPPEYKDAVIKTHDFKKINENYTGLTVQKKGTNIAPVINLHEYYRYCQSKEHIEKMELLPLMAKNIRSADMSFGVNEDTFKNYEERKKDLCIKVCNIEKNKEYLKNMPYKKIADLAITYHLIIDRRSGQIATAKITNELMDKFGVDAEKLHEDAMEMSPKNLPLNIAPIPSFLAEITGGSSSGYPPSEFDNMLVVTNDTHVDGAAVLFYPDTLDMLSKLTGQKDYYILPSSTQEVIIPPRMSSPVSVKDMEMIIKDINAYVVNPEEQLSDRLYHYDAKERIFELAVDYVKRIEKGEPKKSIKEQLKEAEEKTKEHNTKSDKTPKREEPEL